MLGNYSPLGPGHKYQPARMRLSVPFRRNFSTLTRLCDFAMFAYDFFRRVPVKRRTVRTSANSQASHKLLKKKTMKASKKRIIAPPDPDAPAKQAQLRFYEEGL